jgi:environmental stress-induced protein Ves
VIRPELLRASGRQPTPWKNGGGTTHEIAIFPRNAGIQDFEWRVSTALVTEPGSFSMFDNVDRVLAVVSGQLDLAIAGRPNVVLTAASAPFSFAGDVPASGTPKGRTVADLNVMTRRGVYAATVERHQGPRDSIAQSGRTHLVIALTITSITLDEQKWTLGPLDALLFDIADQNLPLSVSGGDHLLVAIQRLS